MTILTSKGKISRAITELQTAFDRGTPLRGSDAPAYAGPRGTLFRSGRRSVASGSSTGVDSIPRWR